jgi:Acetoacetate decarboxylase (ADC)
MHDQPSTRRTAGGHASKPQAAMRSAASRRAKPDCLDGGVTGPAITRLSRELPKLHHDFNRFNRTLIQGQHVNKPSMNLPWSPYPPPPWRSCGVLRFGLLTTREPLTVPDELTHLLDPHRLVILLIRYKEGTLRYDEFMTGSPVRCGLRCGLWVHNIWVNDLASLWGGREIWGIPKQLADFSWNDSAVKVTDSVGPVAEFSLDTRQHQGFPILMLVPGFGQIGELCLFFTGRLRGKARIDTIRVTSWSERLPNLSQTTARPAITLTHFQMTVGPPQQIGSIIT